MLLVLACAPWHALPANALSAVVVLFCGWQLGNALWATPAYSAESLYRPIILLAAFASVASIGRDAATRLFRAGVALLAVLVLVGLLQHFFGIWHLSQNPFRAAATFITPNSFATVINLFLLPLAVVYATRERSLLVYCLALWLFAGLVATQSRGGMLALFAGLAFTAACIGWAGVRRAGKPIARLLVGGAAVWILVVVAATLLGPLMQGFSGASPWLVAPPDVSLSLDPWLGRATWDRAEIYATTLHLILERPWAGAGANMFWPLFEPLKPAIFGEKPFTFAHSDYLQIWLEFGALGLILFLALGAAALALARSISRGAAADPLPLACGSALASCFAHAAVDFPFYVPFVLIVVGGYLGALASGAGDSLHARAWRRVLAHAGGLIRPRVRWVLVLAVLAWLAQPVLAQLAGRRALEVLSQGSVEKGIYWQSVARRLEPRNAVHYWAEAVIWRELALDSGDRAHGAKADALFAQGIAANPPYEFNILLERVRLHRRYPHILEHPASPEEILSWVQRAVATVPFSLVGQVELAQALAYAGRRDEAKRVARTLLEGNPGSPLARMLVEEI